MRAADGCGGLEIRLHPAAALTVTTDGVTARATAHLSGHEVSLGSHPADGTATLDLRTVEAQRTTFVGTEVGPDVIVAGIVHGGKYTELGRLDGRYLSLEVAGGFTGRHLGLATAAGEIEITRWSYMGSDDPEQVTSRSASSGG